MNAAWVTGAGGLLGSAVVARLLADGWHVTAHDIDPAALDRLRDHCAAAALAPEEDRLDLVSGDATDETVQRDTLAAIGARHGGLGLLVNNAAPAGRRGAWADQTVAALAATLHDHVTGPFACTRAAAELLRADGGGAVVNISSIVASRAFRGNVAYATAKGALEAMTRALALELAPVGVRVNAVAPAMVAPGAQALLPADELARRAAIVPLGRPADAREVAATVAFLAGSDASYVTGQILHVDGGMTAQCYSPSDEAPLYSRPSVDTEEPR